MKSFWMILCLVAVGFGMRARADEPKQVVPAAPHGEAARAEGPAKKSCKADPQAQAVLATESELLATRLLVASLALTNQYEEVRNSPSMQQLELDDGPRTEMIRKFIQAHDNYVASSSRGTSGYAAANIPNTVLGVAGLMMMTDKTSGKSARVSGFGMVASALVSSSAVSAGKSLGGLLLKRDTGEMSLRQEKSIQDALDQSVAEPAKYFGDLLGWDTNKRARFSRVLREKAVDTIVKEVSDLDTKYREEKGRYESKFIREQIVPRVVGKLTAIDMIALMQEQGLVSAYQADAIRSLDNLRRLAIQLQEQGSLTRTGAKTILEASGGYQENIEALRRLNSLLKKVRGEIPKDKPTLIRDVDRLVAETDQAVETLASLCALDRQ